MDEHDSTTKEKPPSVLEKIWARIEEDEAFAYSEFCQALASAELWQHDELVLKLLVARFDITAHWYMYLVPSLMTGKDYVGLLNHFAQGNTGVPADRVPSAWRPLAAGRVSYWKGKSLERARTFSSPNDPPITDDSAATKVELFISKVNQAGAIKIRKKHIWTVAGYTEGTEFQRFQRGDARTTKGTIHRFEKVLALSPSEFFEKLKKKIPLS